MRVLIISATFPPEPVVAGRMSSDLARHLMSCGHEVRVVAPYPSRPAGVKYAEFQNCREMATRVEQGILVIRVPSVTAPQSALAARLRESWSFGHWSVRALADPDWRPAVIYEDAWPMLAQAWISRSASRLKIPRVMHIMDVYPESAFGKVPGWVRTFVGQPLLWLDRSNVRQADKVIVLSDTMRRLYRDTRGLAAEAVEVLHTWQDEAPFLRLPQRAEAGNRYGVSPDTFTFMYLGNIGPIAGVEHLIESFAQAGIPRAQLLIVGEGSHKAACVELAAQSKAGVVFLSDPNPAHVPLLQALGDVCLLPMRRGAAASSIPSKLSAYMLSGKPVLASVDEDSETARLITAANCGWVVPPEDTQALARKMRDLLQENDPGLADAGACGRQYALARLSKGSGVRKLAGIVLQAVGTGRWSPVAAHDEVTPAGCVG